MIPTLLGFGLFRELWQDHTVAHGFDCAIEINIWFHDTDYDIRDYFALKQMRGSEKLWRVRREKNCTMSLTYATTMTLYIPNALPS